MTEEVSFKIKCARIAANVLNLVGEMNTQYGDSAFDPIRMFSKLGPDAGLRVRIDDKLSRLLRGNADMESDTDVIDDLIGYFILLRLSMDEQAVAEEGAEGAEGELDYYRNKDFDPYLPRDLVKEREVRYEPFIPPEKLERVVRKYNKFGGGDEVQSE